VAVSLDLPEAVVREVAEAAELAVFDTGFAYHLTSPGVSKGSGLATMADALGLSPTDFVAVGDSENDASLFGVADRAVAVANADESAKDAATHVTEADYADGFLEAVAWLTD
jgi:hydroxymethylpyrimidine pyrophosphatase-like HAD family hydrolase